MMNVVYVLNTTYLFGGSVRSFLSMLDGLQGKGVKPTVVVPDNGGVCQVLKERGIEVIPVCFRPNTYPHNRSTAKDILLFLPKLLARRVVNRRAVARLSRLLASRPIDLVHTNVSVLDVGLRLSRRLGVPHLFHVREYGFLDFRQIYYPWPGAFRALLRKASYSVCITKHIQECHGLAGNVRSRVIYNGIDVPEMEEPVKDREGYFLYAGCIDPSKGLHVLVEAFAGYAAHSARQRELWVAGDVADSGYYERIRAFVTKKGLERRVKFLGGRKDIFRLMQRAEAIVIPSRFEGFGRCMAEAMMNRCLVIAHDTAGLKEQFDNGREMTGREIGLRYKTTEELRACLEQVDSLPADGLEELRRRAYEVARALYTPEVNIDRVFRFYEEIMENEKRK